MQYNQEVKEMLQGMFTSCSFIGVIILAIFLAFLRQSHVVITLKTSPRALFTSNKGDCLL